MDSQVRSLDDNAVGNERCGICTDIVIDRGVLDCCDHWFCFTCIDNWATITNLCPLCKNEFQLITCLPVYDTIGNIKTEDCSHPRDDDWCVQGKNNTLSFPSYYIDEDAVVCLDGDGCKIRNGLSIDEEDLTLDTSIACDSCDIWYHAFCVGFNPECGTSEGSWLCPRCLTHEAHRKLDGISSQKLGNHYAENADIGWMADPSFSSKVSVSVADAGETAVVVSMVEGQQKPEHNTTYFSEVEPVCDTDKETEMLPDTISGNGKLNVRLENIGCTELVCNSVICSDGKGSKASIPEKNKNSEVLLDIPELPSLEDTSEFCANQENNDAMQASLSVAAVKSVSFPLCYSAIETTHRNSVLDEHPKNSSYTGLVCNSLICSDEKGSKESTPANDKNSESRLDIPELPSLEDIPSDSCVSQLDNVVRMAPLTTMTVKGASFPSCYSAIVSDLKADVVEVMVSKPSSSDKAEVLSELSCDTSEAMNQTSESKSEVNCRSGVPVSTLSVNELIGGETKYRVPGSSSKPSPERIASADKTSVNSCEYAVDVPLKHVELSDLATEPIKEVQPHEKDVGCLKNRTRKRELDTEYTVKKVKSDGTQLLLSRPQANSSVLDNSKRSSRNLTHIDVNMSRNTPPKKVRPPDIMSIVQEVDHRPNYCLADTDSVDKSTTKKDNASGPRVKKIMRRVGEKEESSILVQQLRKEISEAVLDRTSNNNDNDNDFDVKLLTAFRAAIVKPRVEFVNKNVPSGRAVKKSLLQKGKTRENLTKKIYGTSTGRRKRAWDRDWEVEFWKHRCTRTKPEKVETLHSVLAFLKKATNSCSIDSGIDEGPEKEKNSILSRVYLADTSVFPRKDDIKPLSVLAESSQTVNMCNTEKGLSVICRSSPQVTAVSSGNTGKRSSTLSCIAETSCKKESSISDSSGSKGRLQNSSKEITSQSDSSKFDKKKWALEVLARKNASINSSGSKGREEDKSALKGNYPLLAQLPMDMRPVPAPSSHNKVPLSVRQAQLYRISEHYLRKTNVAIMRRTADTELAVADAVNIEKGIFERSNSKLVYINLCSQALSQRSDKPPSAETSASNSSIPNTEVTNQVAEETSSCPLVGGWSKVEEALKLAGLSSDSPPDSPCRPTIEDLNVEDNPNVNTRDQGPENVLDMDFHPELDIYGDFEYDLEDEGYEVSKLLQQQNRDSKLKVVLSTLKYNEPVVHQDSNPEHSDPKVVVNDQENLKVRIENTAENGKKEINMAAPLLPKPSEGEIYEELSLTEYEELYGPDEKLFPNKISDVVIGELSKSMDMVAAGESIIPCESEKHQPQDGTTVSKFENEGCAVDSFAGGSVPLNCASGGEKSSAHSLSSKNVPMDRKVKTRSNEVPDPSNSIFKKVEAYVKEHIRPLCKSGVITVDQYRRAVGKTTDKVMKFHHKAENANFLIKEGEKVKKLAEQYVEAAQRKDS